MWWLIGGAALVTLCGLLAARREGWNRRERGSFLWISVGANTLFLGSLWLTFERTPMITAAMVAILAVALWKLYRLWGVPRWVLVLVAGLGVLWRRR